METRTICNIIASSLIAYHNCIKTNNTEWRDRHEDTIGKLVADFLPSGSGWDNGTKLDFDSSSDDKLVFCGAFHHMDENGMYSGWTEHKIIVTPSLTSGFHIKVTGRNRNGIKDYLADLFAFDLGMNVAWCDTDKRYKRV